MTHHTSAKPQIPRSPQDVQFCACFRFDLYLLSSLLCNSCSVLFFVKLVDFRTFALGGIIVVAIH